VAGYQDVKRYRLSRAYRR